MDETYRTESDSLGRLTIPVEALYGIHTVRALENFPLAGRPVHPALISAYGAVKLACARTNRALQILGEAAGNYARISPLDDLNLHQSTNDTYPTALKLAAIRLLHELEDRIVALQEAFQNKEKEFAHVVKVGRTQLQDAVLTTLGQEMSSYAEALSRDRWRVYKCEERLRVVSLGGTAIGTGLAAPRQFVFRVTEALRDLTGIGFARAENPIEATQDADVFVEVSGIMKACAVTLWKISGDLRLMASGPEAGLGEIRLPPRQAGSSIMPGKVNPVIPEAVTQAAMLVSAYDQAVALAAALSLILFFLFSATVCWRASPFSLALAIFSGVFAWRVLLPMSLVAAGTWKIPRPLSRRSCRNWAMRERAGWRIARRKRDAASKIWPFPKCR